MPGIVLGFVLGLGLAAELTFGLAIGLTVGITLGLKDGVDNPHEHDAASITWDPREIVRHDLTAGLAVGLPFGLTIGLAAGLEFGLAFGLTIGLTVGPTFGLTCGEIGVRYVVLLLCTRGWFGTPALPWRLGRFLHWCYHAGLVRQAGIGYQFRHRELQDHLAHHPQPAQVRG
jgi:hypothetical protein